MTFINEYIPEDDLIKYNFKKLNKQRSAKDRNIISEKYSSPGASDEWTIDRDANIWLRIQYVQSDHTMGGFTGVKGWDYYWKGTLMYVVLETLDAHSDDNNHHWAKQKILDFQIPPELEKHRSQIVEDLELSLTAYKGGGVLSEHIKDNEYHFTLEV